MPVRCFVVDHPDAAGSSLAFDRHGRLIAIGAHGTRWLVLGSLVNSMIAGDVILFGWLGRSGRPPTPRERMEARPPYQPAATKRLREHREVPDELNDQMAIEYAGREQEREPVDLLRAA